MWYAKIRNRFWNSKTCWYPLNATILYHRTILISTSFATSWIESNRNQLNWKIVLLVHLPFIFEDFVPRATLFLDCASQNNFLDLDTFCKTSYSEKILRFWKLFFFFDSQKFLPYSEKKKSDLNHFPIHFMNKNQKSIRKLKNMLIPLECHFIVAFIDFRTYFFLLFHGFSMCTAIYKTK